MALFLFMCTLRTRKSQQRLSSSYTSAVLQQQVGQGLPNDFRELHRFYNSMDCFKAVNSVLEINAAHKELFPATQSPVGLQSLVLQYLHCHLLKGQQCSN
eukprot:4005-Heterococcus_DN1.PRE.1